MKQSCALCRFSVGVAAHWNPAVTLLHCRVKDLKVPHASGKECVKFEREPGAEGDLSV